MLSARESDFDSCSFQFCFLCVLDGTFWIDGTEGYLTNKFIRCHYIMTVVVAAIYYSLGEI